MNTRRSTGSISINHNNNHNSKSSVSRFCAAAALTTKTITPELQAINAKICRLVEQHPCMYDRSHPSYMRKSHVEHAWEDISKVMNDTVDNCKERFRNIRTSFARSINVQRRSNRIKPYYLSEELEFLKKHITPGVPVPVKGRRSRDSSNRRGDDNDEYDENDNEDDDEEEEQPGSLLHIKHSMSSDENENENSTDGSEWVAEEHAQSSACQTHAEKVESELLHSQSDDDDQKPKNVLQGVNSNCSFPPKKRQRMGAQTEPSKPKEPTTSSTDPDAVAPMEHKPTAMDFDDAFLQGLRPEMKHMNFHQKLYFKRRVYELLGDIFEGSERFGSQPYLNGQATTATPSPTPLQHLDLLARSGTLQLPKLASKPAKDL